MGRVFKHRTKRFILVTAIGMLMMGAINFQIVKVHVYPLLRELQHEIIVYKTKDYHIKETEHFIIKHEKYDEEMIDLVAKAAEEKYIEVTKMFEYTPKDKITVIVYDDAQKLMQNTNLEQSKPPMGVYYASTIQILSPRLWVPSDQNMEDIFLNQGPMVHEVTHLLVDDLARGNYPLWFTEGMALYQEYVQTGYEWGENLNYDGAPFTVEQLTNDFSSLNEMLAYKRSFELVRSLAEREGFEKLNQVLRELKKGESFENSHQLVYGRSVNSMYENK